MSTLLLFLPARSRLQAQGRATQSLEGLGSGASAREYNYLLSSDGTGISSQGCRSAAKLPHAEQVIAIPAESDLAWQRVTLPRAGRQMRSALAGMLEESLLEDPDGLHFAIEPEAVGGDTAWVAITSRAWLQQQLAELEAAQVFVDRIAPLSWPDAPPRGHFYETGSESSPIGLRWSHPEGVTSLPIDGSLTRQLFPASLVQMTQWSAAPAVAAQAERWLGTAVQVLTPNQRALAVIDSPWNLRQFELAPRTRGLRALRNLLRELMRRNWRPVRWGLAGLVAVHLLGLNLLAWQQSQQVKARRLALDSTLTQAFPQLRVIRDAPIQMQRETDLLRASAGRASEQDLESLLAAAAIAWPTERGPVDSLAFEPGRLQLPSAGWSEAQIQQFRTQLRSEGWQLETSEGRLTVSRAPRVSSPDSKGKTS
ncbi:type II secretion system protein GspL [Paucibacter sp. AS339]|uniref:type II secretion system protein GspL n=1 Tax=Paucibacter hankyongi TaxID=3133434 RepID=UPI0030ADA145